MLDKIKNTVKHTAVFSLGNLSAKIIGFILLPIYLQYLTITEYGILTLLEVTGQILTEIFLLSIPTAMMRWYSFSKDTAEQKSIIFTSFIFLLAVAVLSSLIFVPLSDLFSDLLFSTDQYSSYFTILFVYISFSIINRFILNLIRIKQKSGFYVFLSLIRFITILLLNIYFVVYLNLGIRGILLGLLIGQIVIMILSGKLVWKNIIFNFNFTVLKDMLKYGFPLIFSTLSGMLLTFGDRYLIKIFLGEAAVGIYSAGYKIASLVNIFINNPFQMGYLPIAFDQARKENSQRFFSKILTYLTLTLAIVIILLAFFGGQIVLLITTKTEYYKAISLIPFIGFIFVLKGIQYVVGLSFHIVKKTFYNAIIVILGLILNIVLNIVLLPQINIFGAPISMITSFIFMILLTYYISQKEYPIPYEISKILTIIFIVIVYYIISIETDNLSTYYSLAIKTVSLLSIPFILYLFNFYEEIEIQRIKEGWQKLKTYLSRRKE